MTLKGRGPIPFYSESLDGIGTLDPFKVLFVLKIVLEAPDRLSDLVNERCLELHG